MSEKVSHMCQVRVGVIGAGLIGRKHIEVLCSGDPNYSLAGVADPSPAAHAEAERLGYDCFASLDEMIDKVNPDGVVIAVPNQFHVSAGLACVERGIPMIVEKPVADSVSEALRLIEAAEAAGVATLTGHHRRHNPIMRRAAAMIEEGALGRVVAATSVWLAHKPKDYYDLAWRREPGGGPVLINAIHDIDCLRMLCGDVETVQAVTSNAVREFAVEDAAAAILRFKNGVLGTLLLSDTVSSPWAWEFASGENPSFPYTGRDSILIGGTRGSLSIPSLTLNWHEAGEESWRNALKERSEAVTAADPYYEQMRNFAGVIRGTEPPVLTGRDGTITLATTLAITESATSGQMIRVDDMLSPTN